MAKSSTSFDKGKSGNPRGRPPKARALTNILEKAGTRKVRRDDGKEVPIRQFVADNMWDALKTGVLKLENGITLTFKSMDQYVDVLRFLQAVTDGPPPAAVAVDLSTQGQPLGITMIEVIKTQARQEE